MLLHNEKVNKGDKVYDLLEGVGTVVVADNTSIGVQFGNAGMYSYNSVGSRVGNTPSRFPPMLYWQNPIVVIPVKGDKRWEAMKRILNSVRETIIKI